MNFGVKNHITLGQAKLLITAAQWANVSARDLAGLVVTMTGAETLDALTPAGLADVMDRFVAIGFRHPAVPMVTAVQLAALDEARRRVGLDGRQIVALVRQLGGVRTRRHLDGASFLAVLERLAADGAGVPVPSHGFMTRRLMRLVHEAAYHQRWGSAELLTCLAPIGGVLHASQLDRRGFMRLMIAFDRVGVPSIEPAPIVAAEAGMVTQAQANLIWRLWLDFGGWEGDVSPAALDRALAGLLGLAGGLASLTRAGARAVIDRFMVPRLKDRRLDGDVDEELPSGPPHAGQDRASRERPRRARRRGRSVRH